MAVLQEDIYAKEAVDLAKVREAIIEVVESDAEKRGDGTSLYGTFIRLAWHCSGSYSQYDGLGGSNGAKMRFDPEASWGNNAGLKAVAQPALEPVKAKFPEMSYAGKVLLLTVELVYLRSALTLTFAVFLFDGWADLYTYAGKFCCSLWSFHF